MNRLFLAIAIVTAAESFAEEPKQLSDLRTSYNSAVDRALSPLNRKYIESLQRMKADFTKAKNTDAVIAIDAEIARVTLRPTKVPADAVLHDGRWFKSYSEQCTWDDAKKRCEELGGRLAVVRDALTHQFILKLAIPGPVWLGATDQNPRKRWEWVDGTVIDFKAWKPEQPDNWGENQHFMQMIDGQWDDTESDRSDVTHYLCEWPSQ